MAIYHECLNAEGNLAISSLGFAHTKFAREFRGNITKQAFFGADGKPTLWEGAAVKLLGYDSRGNFVQETYLDAEGSATTNSDGIAKKRFAYDARGQIIRTDYFDLEGHLTLGAIGCASERHEFNGRGRVVEATCLGVEGNAVNRRDGYSRVTTCSP